MEGRQRPGGYRGYNPRVVDRAVGAVLGSAVGDALGSGYEFTVPEASEEIRMKGGGAFRWSPGEWTDDTAMALGILDAICSGRNESATGGPVDVTDGLVDITGGPVDATGGLVDVTGGPVDVTGGLVDVTAVAGNFLAWFAADPPDIGIMTSRVLARANGRPEKLAAAARAYLVDYPHAAGNGALMRTAPVALAAFHDRDEIARLATEIASLTHAHRDSVSACVLWSLAIQQAITGSGPDDSVDDDSLIGSGWDDSLAGSVPDDSFDWESAVRNGLGHLPSQQRQRWSELIDEAVVGPAKKFTPNGWVVTAFQAALSAIINTRQPVANPAGHLRDSLIAVIRVGDDTDTIAAIAGGLLGARWGLSAIPAEWLEPLHGDRRYGDVVTGKELIDLAHRALRTN